MARQVYSASSIWQQIKPAVVSQKKSLFIGLMSLAILGISQAGFLLLVKSFLKALFSPGTSQTIPIGDLLPANVIKYTPFTLDYPVAYSDLAVAVPVAIIVVGLLMSLALYYYQFHQQSISMFVAKFLREKVFSRIINQDYSSISSKSAGSWMSLVMNDILFLQNRFSDLLTALFKDSVVILSCFAVLFYTHAPTALILALASPFIAFFMGRTGKRIAKFSEKFQRELSSISAITLNLRERFDFIRAQNGEQRELDWFNKHNDNYYRMVKKSILVRSAFAPIMELIGVSIFAGLVWGIGSGWWENVSPDLVLQFIFATGIMLRPLREVGEQVARLQETLGALSGCMTLLEASPPSLSSEKDSVKASFDTLEVSKIDVGYQGDAVFSGGDIRLIPGKTIAVIGASGSGKSTLIKTLAGLLPPICWQANQEWNIFASQTSLVSQEPFLFADTVRSNLVYGSSGEHLSDEMIFAALKKVCIFDQIQNLPEGLDTHFRSLGSNLSGGQIQRLVLARALIRNKKYLLLDEATSAIDSVTEQEITELLISMCKKDGIGLFAITHRLEWLPLYDEVYYLHAGKVLAKGAHKELMKLDAYARFVLPAKEISS
jgi:subfamily B ATP-binding cassette protein MsbA